ncbi:MAG: DMT family transporter [Gemmatimonadaceae bacterium]|nr:DMT family transporter [Gemmatimonadaceae bacterium]MCW5826571.1 DMT family transporter [Gemmatimonadaceae bacterium]
MNSPTRPEAGALGAGTFFTLLAAAGFAAVAILTSLATAAGLTLATVLAWRYTLAAVVLVAWVGARNYKRIRPNEMLQLVALGGGGQALLVFVALSALAYIPAATLAFLFYTYPAWVALVQSVRGAERLDGRRALALALSFAGIGVMVGMPGAAGLDWRGVALAIGAAMIYGAYIPMMRVLAKDHPVAPVSAYGKIGSALAFLVLAVSDGSFTYRMEPSTWAVIAVLTLFSTVLPGVFFLMGLVRLGPVRTAIVSTVEPFLTALLGVLVLRQALTLPTVLGGVLIIGAVLLLQLRRDRVA